MLGGRGALLSSTQVLGQLLRKESRVVLSILRLWGRAARGPKGQSSKEGLGI